MTGEEVKAKIIAVAPLIITVLAMVNSVLTLMGQPSLEIGNEQITTTISGIAEIVGILWCWWKNNNWTKKAQVAQPVLNLLKEDKITAGQVDNFVKDATDPKVDNFVVDAEVNKVLEKIDKE